MMSAPTIRRGERRGEAINDLDDGMRVRLEYKTSVKDVDGVHLGSCFVIVEPVGTHTLVEHLPGGSFVGYYGRAAKGRRAGKLAGLYGTRAEAMVARLRRERGVAA